MRRQGTGRNEQPIIGVVGPKKAVRITAFFRHKQIDYPLSSGAGRRYARWIRRGTNFVAKRNVAAR
jgi:hypothetical protein